jgi:hypothetical protein
MAKVGRASRNASLKRVEGLSGAKSVTAAESGEIYIVSAASTVTLPPVKEGAYLKFIVSAEITSASALVLQTETADAGMMVGQVTINVDAGTGVVTDNAAAARAIAGNNHDKLTIGDAGNAVLPGSRVECVCDGTNWVVTGFILGATADVTAVFADQ